MAYRMREYHRRCQLCDPKRFFLDCCLLSHLIMTMIINKDDIYIYIYIYIYIIKCITFFLDCCLLSHLIMIIIINIDNNKNKTKKYIITCVTFFLDCCLLSHRIVITLDNAVLLLFDDKYSNQSKRFFSDSAT